MLLKRLMLIMLCLIGFANANAVIILDSTFKKSGFAEAEALAKRPQFKSLIFISEIGSGSWIGNYQGHGYVLTAGHVFEKDSTPDEYVYKTLDGKEYHADKIYIHPLWNGISDDRTGYDSAIVRLTTEVDDAGSQPVLYSGTAEAGKELVFIGYGYRGHGTKGQDTDIDTENTPAAAVGLIEQVQDAEDPIPSKGDAGSYLGTWLPKEDGSIENPLKDDGITTPVSSLAGNLGSGDSGGPAWIKTDKGWAIAGINVNGDGNAEYGKQSWFARVSHLQSWIKSIVPNAKFVD